MRKFAPVLRILLTVILAFLFLVQSFTRTFIYVNYQVNKNYIANVLCENKDNKELHCEGKCHLKKQLAKEEKQEGTPAGTTKVKLEINLFNNPVEKLISFFPLQAVSTFIYIEKRSTGMPSPVFHPPTLRG